MFYIAFQISWFIIIFLNSKRSPRWNQERSPRLYFTTTSWRKASSYRKLTALFATWRTCSESEMGLSIALRRKKYAICFAPVRRRECCCSFTFKKSWRILAMREHYPSTRSICQMLTGASKLFLLLIHSTWFLILNICLLSVTEGEEGRNTFPQPKIFCS